MTLLNILRDKGCFVHTIGPEATLDDVVGRLVRHNIGSLVVVRPRRRGEAEVLGIITERDVLQAQAGHRAPLDRLNVAGAMSRDLITAEPLTDLQDAMQLMTQRRVRHLPVMQEERLLGIVSIGDLMKALVDELTLTTWAMSRELQERSGMWT